MVAAVPKKLTPAITLDYNIKVSKNLLFVISCPLFNSNGIWKLKTPFELRLGQLGWWSWMLYRLYLTCLVNTCQYMSKLSQAK